MLLDLAKALSFFLSILSLYPVALSAFFVPGTRFSGWRFYSPCPGIWKSRSCPGCGQTSRENGRLSRAP
jgi:heme/copper-type cytochrome/quinol oxidase subunit 1